MKYFILIVITIVCMLSVPVSYAGPCYDIELTGIDFHEAGRFNRYEVLINNSGEHTAVAFVISLQHKHWLGSTLDITFKMVRAVVEPDTSRDIKFTAPVPKNTGETLITLEGIVTGGEVRTFHNCREEAQDVNQ